MSRYFLILMMQFFTGFIFGQPLDFKQLSSGQFSQILSSDKVTLIDVRTKGEFGSGHISDAGQLNFYALDFRKNLLLLPKDKPVYLYCNTGYRSRKAAEFLTKNGYGMVYNLEHGIMEWNLHDLPVVVEPDARPDIKDRMEPDEFYALIKTDKLVLIDFYAPWCGPCRQMMPIIDSLGTEYNAEHIIVKINVDASKKLVKELRIGSVPYLVVYRNGKVLNSRNGLLSREELIELLAI